MIISYNFELKSIKPCHPPVAVAHGQPFAHRATQPEPPRRPFAPGQGYPHGRMQSAVPITSTTATMKATPRPGFPLPAQHLSRPRPRRGISPTPMPGLPLPVRRPDETTTRTTIPIPGSPPSIRPPPALHGAAFIGPERQSPQRRGRRGNGKGIAPMPSREHRATVAASHSLLP